MDESVVKNLEQGDEVDHIGRILLYAADYIERNGHCTGNLFDGTKACAVGGMIRAISSQVGRTSLAEPMKRFGKYIGTSEIGNWNDRHSKEEVVLALRAAAYAKV